MTEPTLPYDFDLLYDIKTMQEIEAIANDEGSHSDASPDDLVTLFKDNDLPVPDCLSAYHGNTTIWIKDDGTWSALTPEKDNEQEYREVKITAFSTSKKTDIPAHTLPAYPVTAKSTGRFIKLSLAGLEEHEYDADLVDNDTRLQDTIEMLRLAVKDDVVPDTMFSDGHHEEASTIYYVGVLEDFSTLVSCYNNDENGGLFLDICNRYMSQSLRGFYRVTIEDNLL
jgi:hypothetical protein